MDRLTKPENPEEENEGEERILDFNNPDFIFEPAGRHQYRQRGPYLVCMSCELQHAVYIGVDKIMTGEKEDGTPELVDKDVVMNG